MAIPTATAPKEKVVSKSYRDWLKGTVTAYDDGRTPVDGLRASGNMVLDQDGTLRPRPSLVRYGTALPGTLLGEIFELTKTLTSSTENWQVAMFNVSSTTRPYVSKDGGAWSATTGKTYDNSASAHYVQIDDKVIIMNGTDSLSYLDVTTVGSTNTITAFTTLPAPTSVAATKTGLASTTVNYFYRVTANGTFGETDESLVAQAQVDRPREQWDNTTNFVTVTWVASVGAVATTTYNVYVGTATGQEALIASGISGTAYKDNGTAPQDTTRIAPAFNNTTGPKTTRGYLVNGRLYMVGDKDHPRYVWYGGTGNNVLDFTPLSGGGNVELGRGTKEFPVWVGPFREHSGNPAITVLCKGTNGHGKRYVMTPNSITIGTYILDTFDIQEENGQAGTDSPDGVILYNDNLWYPSRDGFKTTGTKPQLQNVLSTDTVSNTILNDVIALNNANMNKCVGLGWQNRLYWALANGSTGNNEIWVLDLQRGGAWMKPLNIAADWMMLYNDNSGTTHFIILKNNIMYELTYAATTADDGTPFNTNATSGILTFSENGQDWAKLRKVTFIFLRPQGQINVLVSGHTEDDDLANLGTGSPPNLSSVAGWGEAGWGGSPDMTAPVLPEIFGWSNFSVVPTIIGVARYPVEIDVDEEVQWWGWEIDSNTAGVDFNLSDVIAEYVVIGPRDLN